jgi:uncharacterized membrane protein
VIDTLIFIGIVLALVGIALYFGKHSGRTETKADSQMQERSGTGPWDLP